MRGRAVHTAGPDGAARLDAAIDALLEDRVPLMSVGDGQELEMLATARLLHEALPRFHPRFGFETRLAHRLTGSVADDRSLQPPIAVEDVADPADAAIPSRRRTLVAGGAVASGLSLAISLAGAALMARRRSRPTGGIP
jgi:hypothetical protein